MERREEVDPRLRAAVESSPSGLLMIDAEGRIVLVNREVERLFGYPREELLGRPVELLVPEASRRRHPEDRKSYFAKPSVRAMGAGRELFGVRKDGTEVPVEIGLTPVATADGLYVISSIVDISARKEAEREHAALEDRLRQSQKLEAVGRLAGGIAHDFNNVLAAIVGYGELAAAASRSPAVREDLAQLLKAARRGRELVDRILRFSRRQEVRRRPIEVRAALQEAAGLLRPTLPASIQVELDFDDAPERILADPTSVQQIVLNLVTNAVDAMPRGGRVRISAEPFYARDSVARAHPGLREGHYVLFRVADEGAGMNQDTLARAFEPFFTSKQAGHGSGLGLAMVHGIVTDHGGAVWIESEPGRGTIVHFLLPKGAAADEPVAESDVPSLAIVEAGVLLVDDEPSLTDIGRRRLEQLGYEVAVATSGAGALELLDASPELFDLVVTDYSMPGMNGAELARRLAETRPDLPVIILSGYLEGLDAESFGDGVFRAVYRKPLTAVEFASAVQAGLRARDRGAPSDGVRGEARPPGRDSGASD